MNVNLNNTDNNDYVRGYKDGKKAGISAEHERAQKLVDALNQLKEGAENHTILFIDKALQQWNGTQPDRPCPHCGKELFRDRNLCCRACGEEITITQEQAAGLLNLTEGNSPKGMPLPAEEPFKSKDDDK